MDNLVLVYLCYGLTILLILILGLMAQLKCDSLKKELIEDLND